MQEEHNSACMLPCIRMFPRLCPEVIQAYIVIAIFCNPAISGFGHTMAE